MRKVLFVVDQKQIGGVSVVLEDILNNIDKKNNEIDLLILSPHGDRLNDIEGINVIDSSPFFKAIDIHFKHLIERKAWSLLYNKLLTILLLKTGLIEKKIIKERKRFLTKHYDTEIAFKDGFCSFFVGYGDSDIKINWLHTDYATNDPCRKYQKSYSKVLDQFNYIVAISKEVKNNFINKYGHADKTIIINNFVNEDKVRIGFKIKHDPIANIELVTVGRLNPIKAYDRLLRIIAKLNNEELFNNTILKIIGDGPERNHLESLTKELNITDKVIFYGKQLNPYQYMTNSDLFIISSLSEAYPLVVIEAFMLGIPILTVKFSSAPEMIENNINGLITDNNEEALYEGLKKLLLSPNILKRMQQEAKNYKYHGYEIIDLINKLIKGEVKYDDKS